MQKKNTLPNVGLDDLISPCASGFPETNHLLQKIYYHLFILFYYKEIIIIIITTNEKNINKVGTRSRDDGDHPKKNGPSLKK